MSKLINPRKELIIILITLLPSLFLLVFWNKIPMQIPSHWNVEGKVDDYSSRYFTPLLGAIIYLLLLFVPMIDPKKRNYEFFSKAYFGIRLSLALLFCIIGIGSYYFAMGHAIKMDRIIITGVLVLFTIMGNFMGNIRPNWFFGIRTPWTLENETVWTKTHRLGGKLWFWGGLALLFVSFVIPEPYFAAVFMSGVFILALIPVTYSWWLYRQIKQEK